MRNLLAPPVHDYTYNHKSNKRDRHRQGVKIHGSSVAFVVSSG